jgi:hypothetical protein
LLPEDAWLIEYYQPLEKRIKELRLKHKDNSGALKMLEKYQNEVNMVKNHPKEHRSAFYILQKL